MALADPRRVGGNETHLEDKDRAWKGWLAVLIGIPCCLRVRVSGKEHIGLFSIREGEIGPTRGRLEVLAEKSLIKDCVLKRSYPSRI